MPDAAPVSSPASSTDDLLGDVGPIFEATAADAAAAPAIDAQAAADVLAGGELWDEQRVRGLLSAKGELLHSAVAIDKESDEWRYTQADLAVIAPAMTRILNRYDATRAAAAAGDEAVVAIGFAGYAARSYSQRRVAQRELAAGHEDAPPAGDPEWRAAVHPDADQLAGDVAADAPEFPDDHEAPPIAAPRRF